MNCPRDGSPLKPRKFLDVMMDSCPTCKGVWLDEGEFATIAGIREDILAGRKNPEQEDRALICPSCDVAMEEIHYSAAKKTIVDKCPQCKGIWLDTDEMKKCLKLVSDS